MTVSTNSEGVPTYWGTSGRQLQMLITAVATTDFLLFGYDQGVMSGIIESDAFLEDFPEAGWGSNWQGFIVSIYAVGCLFGAIFILTLGDKLGRRKAIFIGATVMIIGVIIQVACVGTSSGSTAQFIVGRFITGLGNGINTSTIPTYQAECSKAHNRGKVICIEGGNVAIGTLIAYWIDYGCTYGPHDLVWRFPIAFQCFFALIVLGITTRLPESPRWLLSHDRQDEATVILAALQAKPVDDAEVKLEAGIILDSIKMAGGFGESTPISVLFTGGKTQHFRRMLLGAGSQFMQQLSGCNAVIYYFPVLFRDSIGTTKNLSLLLGGINMVVYSIFATTSWFLVERVGRRKLFLWGTVGQCLSMVLVFACLIPGDAQSAKGAAVGLFTYIAFFGATWLPLPWLYPAEINPLKTRAKANALSTVSNWCWNFFIVMITPVLIDSISWGTYLFFAILNALFFPVIYCFYPETSGRSLEEIDLIFAKGYLEKMSYVTAAKELPKLDAAEIDAKAREYGFQSSDDEAGQMKDARYGEKEEDVAYNGGGQMA
ncbi:general substrate transporter [Aureobasidium pullulans]|uniref:General substrate transporter n=1 Tax=Aureobasidium pullulans TaxID=5580 RepID=A0A4S9X3L0_AURPU|nr:general substrate transporter [Aureobasidium pullulans]